MKKAFDIILGIALVWVVIQLINGMAEVYFNPLCGNDLQSLQPSPDQHKMAAVMVRDCGATTGYATLLYVKNRGDENTDDQLVLSLDGKYPIALKWQNSTHLLVSYPLHPNPEYIERDKPPLIQRTQWRDVLIQYRVR